MTLGRGGWFLIPIALIGYLAVFDGAVESLLANSPPVWWLAAPLACAGLLSLWLWRPGGWLLSRAGAAGAAATPWGLLTAAAAAAPWFPGGGVKLVLFLQHPVRVRWTVFGCVVVWSTLLAWWATRGTGDQKWRRLAAALMLAGAAASIGVGAFRRPSPAKPAGSIISGDVAASISALSQEDRQRAYDAEVAGLRERLERLQAFVDAFPREVTDVDALAETLPSATAAFEFVRDNVAVEPYPGIFKGIQGTLVTRGGNSLERALLLAALLERKGLQPTIAHATLSGDRATALLADILASPSATERMLASLPRLPLPAVAADSPPGLQQAIATRAAAGAESASTQARSVQAMLNAAAGQPDVAADEASRVAVVAVTDHFWVRASVDGRLTDFDPSTRTADVGQHLAEPTETLDPGNLDESLYQHVEFRLVAESLDGASLRASDVLKAQVRATELFGKNIRFSVSPQSFETAEAT